MVVIVPVGLPGSGKTTKIKQEARKYMNTQYIDGDSFSTPLELAKALDVNASTSYIDGLFLSSKSQKDLEDAIIETHGIGNIGILYMYWRPNVNACIYNDKKRNRDIKADSTIRNAVVDKPTGAIIHVFDTPKYDEAWDLLTESMPNAPFYIKSDEWSKGGTWCDCLDNTGVIQPQVPLNKESVLDNSTIRDLDKLLDFDCKTLIDTHSHLFVESTRSYNDYYGGCEVLSSWVIDVSDVFRAALEVKYEITEQNMHTINDTILVKD